MNSPAAETSDALQPQDLPYQDFSFPLNVFAHALVLEEGKVDYLHYGLFDGDKHALSDAQQHSTDLLLGRLPTFPCRILEVGIGVGSTLSELAARGYQVTGITPDQHQVEVAKRRVGSKARLICSRLEDLQDIAASYDVILFQESAQYVDLLVLFARAREFLVAGGSLLILDEVALKRVAPGPEGLHLLPDMLAQAKRAGFELREMVDVSLQAAPTLDYLLDVTARHRDRLIADLALSPEQLDQLDQSNRAYREKYTQGRYGYALLQFQKGAEPRWRVSTTDQGDTEILLGLFRAAFGYEMSPALWKWKYGAGAESILVWRGEDLVAHYGGMPRDIMFFGSPQRAVQIGDVMVHPGERGVLTRQGPFFLAAATFLERNIGYGRPFLLGFGFPTERAMRLPKRLGLYGEVGQLTEVRWHALPCGRHLGSKIRPMTPDSEEDHRAVDILWSKMSADLKGAIVGVRNGDFIRRRYLQHPVNRYETLLITSRLTGQPKGLVVLRMEKGACELVDLVGPLANIPLMISRARDMAGCHGLQRLYCWITGGFSNLFALDGGECAELDIRIPTNVWTSGPEVEAIQNRWWLMGGDSDFR